jgi:hypothetical protein
MPNVLKKVVEEGKKMIHEMNEPPKHTVPNNPPSIEKWLNNTVDPFVDDKTPSKESPSPKPRSAEKEKEKEREREKMEKSKTPRKSSHEHKTPRKASPKEMKPESELSTELSATTTETTSTATGTTVTETVTESESPKEAESPSSGGLRRSRATRSSSSPWKQGAKRPFLGVLKAAFQGESAGHIKHPKVYQSQEERLYEELTELTGTDWTGSEITGSELTGSEMTGSEMTSSEVTGSYLTGSYLTGSELTESELHSASQPNSRSNASPRDRSSDQATSPTTPKMAGPRLRPPTNGQYELSTILSEEGSSVVDSDLTSDLSHSTLTQSTNLTKDSELSKSSSRGSGLKRRLTRHSDLVSVLSLPDNSNIPTRIKSNRSRPSLRKARGSSDNVSVDELLREFADDENLYIRELKTLVDGVVPVLLSHVVGGNNAAEIFEPTDAAHKVDGLSKSVVSMGVALEKLKNAHKKAPISDIRRLAHWAHGVVPIYNSYLSAWRLGFQDLVVNLAPRSDTLDDEDSLLDALPRNEHGDIINAAGERVDVAHLLKRPLFQVRRHNYCNSRYARVASRF